MEKVEVVKDRFRIGKDPFIALGFNYWHSESPGSDPVGGDWSVLCDYSPETVERELKAMADAGANTLRVWFAYAPEHWQNNTITETALKNLNHFLGRCCDNGIYVIFTVGGGGSLWGVSRGLGDVFSHCPAELYVGGEIERLFLADVMELLRASNICLCDNLLAIDLANEPIFAVPVTEKESDVGVVWQTGELDFDGSVRTPNAVSKWKDWAAVNTDLGNDAEIPVNEDFLSKDGNSKLARYYQQFVYDCFNRHTALFSKEIKAAYPGTLVTIGFGFGGTGADFDTKCDSQVLQILTLTQNIREMHDGLDFICVHLYDGTDPARMKFLREFVGSSKPVLIEEFGHLPCCVEEATLAETNSDKQEQERLWQCILDGVLEFNYAGALGCNYCDTGNSEPVRNVWSRMGIVTRDGSSKPALEVFKKIACSDLTQNDFHPKAVAYDKMMYRNDIELIGSLFKAKAD
jgi:hypothetical protein